MELNHLIPDSDTNWSIKKNTIMYYKYTYIPVCFIRKNIVYVYLDNKIHNQIIKLTKHLSKLNCKFYFESPSHSNPKVIYDPRNIIDSYFIAYSNMYFYIGFKKTKFDLIKNMVEWCKNNNQYESIKPCYEKIKNSVFKKVYNHYTNRYDYNYPLEIRTEFESLYREIQINNIL